MIIHSFEKKFENFLFRIDKMTFSSYNLHNINKIEV
jgi:hypothetical protein